MCVCFNLQYGFTDPAKESPWRLCDFANTRGMVFIFVLTFDTNVQDTKALTTLAQQILHSDCCAQCLDLRSAWRNKRPLFSCLQVYNTPLPSAVRPWRLIAVGSSFLLLPSMIVQSLFCRRWKGRERRRSDSQEWLPMDTFFQVSMRSTSTRWSGGVESGSVWLDGYGTLQQSTPTLWIHCAVLDHLMEIFYAES